MFGDLVSEQERIKQIQAEGNTLFQPAKIVACKLGKRHPKKHGATMIFTGKTFTISYDTYAPNLDVHYMGKPVLTFHLGSITQYITGPWVKTLKELAKPLIAVEKAEKKRSDEQKHADYLSRWGLDK